MKTTISKSILGRFAAGASALITIFALLPQAEANPYPSGLHERVVAFDRISERMLDEYRHELKCSGRWYPCGYEATVHQAMANLAGYAENLHRLLDCHASFELVHRAVCDARNAANYLENIRRCGHLSSTSGAGFLRTNQALSAVEICVNTPVQHHRGPSRGYVPTHAGISNHHATTVAEPYDRPHFQAHAPEVTPPLPHRGTPGTTVRTAPYRPSQIPTSPYSVADNPIAQRVLAMMAQARRRH